MQIRRSINQFSRGSAAASAVAVLLTGLLFFPPSAISRDDSGFPDTPASKLEYQKLEVETNKLRLEAEKLREEAAWIKLTPMNTVVLSVLVTALTALSSFLLATWAHRYALVQATHAERLKHYPVLVSATSALAVYFPHVAAHGFLALDKQQCGAIGRAMSRWYFRSGGLLMGAGARDAYFDFVRAVTRAHSFAGILAVPQKEQYAEYISVAKLRDYRNILRKRNIGFDSVEGWEFGPVRADGQATSLDEVLSLKFKDYVYLQELGSKLRSALAEDIRSRQGVVSKPPRN